MKISKKFIAISLYIIINMLIFFVTFYYVISLIKVKGITITSKILVFQFIRSLSHVLLFNAFVYFIIKVKKIDVTKFLK